MAELSACVAALFRTLNTVGLGMRRWGRGALAVPRGPDARNAPA
jgi:hypothetical protein